MSSFAIKGHSTRGKEIIKLLRILGGKGGEGFAGNEICSWYYINGNGYIDYKHYSLFENTMVFTLEDFLNKYPYKVGDRVYNIVLNKQQTITNISWYGDINEIVYQTDNNEYVYANYLQPYKEENIEDKGILVEIDLTREYKKSDKIEIILGDYEIKEEDGKIYLVNNNPKYPKYISDCYNTLEDNELIDNKLICAFKDIVTARNAYWKIAGKEMGLGKSWKPDWTDNYQKKFTISYYQGEINLTNGPNVHRLLAFPTQEMRDIFYENFKEIIEQIKELL